jgi:nucleotidyltransferase substrate binding protein (TIGR01987 family)
MEITKEKYENFLKAYRALDRSIGVLKDLEYDVSPAVHDVIVAGIIKHFEMAYELAWKFLKQYLKAVLEVEASSPKSVFKACYEYQVLPESTVNDLLRLAEDRNLTVHMYDQTTAEELLENINQHYQAIGKIVELIPMQRITL